MLQTLQSSSTCNVLTTGASLRTFHFPLWQGQESTNFMGCPSQPSLSHWCYVHFPNVALSTKLLLELQTYFHLHIRGYFLFSFCSTLLYFRTVSDIMHYDACLTTVLIRTLIYWAVIHFSSFIIEDLCLSNYHWFQFLLSRSLLPT